MTRVLLAVVLAVSGSGCLIIPEIPHYSDDFPTRRNVADVSREFPRPGQTTLEEVLLTLGEPDLVELKPKHRFIYVWNMVVAELVVVIPSPVAGPAVGGGTSLMQSYRLTIEFDSSGVVSGIPEDSRPPPESGEPRR
jgi:outer membrane protein assembly factor BamE (lipoprotein component of BamABCDE complex)